MRSRMLFLLIIMLSVFSWAQFAGTYEIYVGENQVGECTFEFTSQPGNYNLKSTANITISGNKTTYNSETIYDEGYHPSSYSVDITSTSGKQTVNCIISGGKAIIKAGVGLVQTEEIIDFPSTGYVIDQHNFAQWWILGNLINPQVGIFKYNCLIPQLLTTQTLNMKNIDEKTINGKNVTFFEGELGELELYLAVSHDNEILSVSFPAQQLEAKLGKIEKLVEKSAEIPKYSHPLAPEDLTDNDFMKDIINGKVLDGSISLDPKNRLDRIFLNSRMQTFIGAIDPKSIDGSIEINKIAHRVTLSGEWPTFIEFNVDPEYLSPAPSIDSDDPHIIDRAAKIVDTAPTIWEAVRSINIWVNRNIEYAMLRYGAKEAIFKGKGDSYTKAMVCVAMLRAVDIPARVIQGILMADVPLDHTWLEVYLGEDIGWAPMDPTTGEVDDISARHISLWLGEEEPPVYAREVIVSISKMK